MGRAAEKDHATERDHVARDSPDLLVKRTPDKANPVEMWSKVLK